jgi:hypothetical protein
MVVTPGGEESGWIVPFLDYSQDMKPMHVNLIDAGQFLARWGIVLLVAGCQTSRPPAKPPVRSNRPAVVEVTAEGAEVSPKPAFFVVRTLDQDGTRENARHEPVVTYHLHLQHPEFTAPGFPALNRIIQSYALDTKKEFVQSTMDVDINQLNTAGFPWTLELKFNLAYASPQFISLLFTRVVHTGGTQFSTDFYTINYDLNQQKTLLLPDLLATPFAFNSLSALVVSRLRQQPNLVTTPQLLQDGAGPLAENYANFTLSAEGLSVLFVAGQVAEVSNGPQRVELPFTLVASLLRPEVLAWLKAGPR